MCRNLGKVPTVPVPTYQPSSKMATLWYDVVGTIPVNNLLDEVYNLRDVLADSGETVGRQNVQRLHVLPLPKH